MGIFSVFLCRLGHCRIGVLHAILFEGRFPMAIPTWCHDGTALDLLRVARSQPKDPVHRQNLATWLKDNGHRRGDPDSLALSKALLDSFQSGKLVLLPKETAQRLHPFVGALHGWLHGVQDNSDKVARLWLLPPHSIELDPGVWLEMLTIPAGTFMMGTPGDEDYRDYEEKLHEVAFTQPFLIGKYPVTQSQWYAVMGHHPSHFKGPSLPVEMVSWDNAQSFCKKVQKKTGQIVALPAEAQWEYACRAGTRTPFHFGRVLNGKQANCDGNEPYGNIKTGPSLEKTSPVGSYLPNAWGLYDMHGNVLEWCQDWQRAYQIGAFKPSHWIIEDECRILRGGSWGCDPVDCRAGFRGGETPNEYDSSSGFRIIQSL